MKKQADELKIHTTKPMKGSPEFITCPLCSRKIQSRGIGGHLNFIHKIKGISLNDIEAMTLRGTAEKELRDLEIEGKKRLLEDVSPAKIDLGSPADPESKPDLEAPADPVVGITRPSEESEKKVKEREASKDDLEPPADLKSKDTIDDPGEKKNPVERRKFNWIPFFSPFNRRSYRK